VSASDEFIFDFEAAAKAAETLRREAGLTLREAHDAVVELMRRDSDSDE